MLKAFGITLGIMLAIAVGLLVLAGGCTALLAGVSAGTAAGG